MPIELKLRYKGYFLRLYFRYKSYYTIHEFEPGKYTTNGVEPGKTMYQILFEHLVDKKPISYTEIAEHYKGANPLLRGPVIEFVVKKIKAAAKKSPDARLKRMAFVINKSRCGMVPSNVVPVIEKMMRNLHRGGRKPTYAQIRAVGLKKVNEVDPKLILLFSKHMIRNRKDMLGLPMRSDARRRFRKMG
jgi:hypothetical protein